MAMIKVCSAAGWDFGGPAATPLKLSSRGLVGHDRREFLKTASHAFLPDVERLRGELAKYAGDYEPVHLIALGATEGYGANRNGDGFKEAVCRARHDTFVKHAAWHRDHKNKDNPRRYGVVKASAYHDGMKRVELLSFLFKSAAAAERHGGYVADRELDKLARGLDLDVSMAGRVPFDKCSFCGNEARTREDYCTAETCGAGGCADNLAKVVKAGADLHHLHVDNPDADWFDISDVHRRADRVAQGSRADYLSKAAAEYGSYEAIPSHEVAAALGLAAPPCVLDLAADAAAARVKLAYALAAAEAAGPLGTGPALAFSGRPAAEAPAPEKLAACLAALADLGGVLPLAEYARLVKRSGDAAAAAPLVPGCFTRAVADGSAEALAASRVAAAWPDSPPQSSRDWAARHKRAYSLDAGEVEGRAVVASLRGLPAPGAPAVKSAASPGGASLAAEYAAYELAALERAGRSGRDLGLTAVFMAQQNRVL